MKKYDGEIIVHNLSKCTAFGLACFAAFMVTVKDNPNGVHLIPIANFFLQLSKTKKTRSTENSDQDSKLKKKE
jgi:hypothetical protein